MSAQPPLEHLLGVPDLVENVFLRLDPANRRAFFQAHRDVAQNGLVLAHAKLQIELTPGVWAPLSLQDQWQRVLRLTRSQPLRCPVLAGPNQKRLQDFLLCVPRGKSKEKQNVLQGSEVQLQVQIKLETGGIPRLEDLLRSRRSEQQAGAVDTRVQLVLDLCGRELVATIEGNMELPCCCTLRNGGLQLPSTSRVRVASKGVRLESIVARGTGTQETVVHVGSGGSLVMEGSRVEGGVCEAVMVSGAEASLCAQRCSMQSSKGHGLMVCHGGRAILEYVTASDCGWRGVGVIGENSMVSASHCHMAGNRAINVFVDEGGFPCLHYCSSNGSREGHGWYIGPGSRLVASDSSTSSNERCGAVVSEGSASLLRVTTSSNGGSGLLVREGGSLEACDSETSSNKLSGAFCVGGGSISLCRVTANSNWGYGWGVSGQGSRLEAKACPAQHNSLGNTIEASNGRIIYLDA